MICECGEKMEITDEDSRQFWYEITYQCEKCGKTKIHRKDYDELGLIINETIEEE